MRVIKVNVYKFDELSKWDVKEKVLEDFRSETGYKFYKYLKNNGYLTIKELYKEGYKKLDDNCCLTGYCVDNDILEPILKLMKKPSIYKNTTAWEIIRKCLNNWLKCCKDDLEYSYTDESIEELI